MDTQINILAIDDDKISQKMIGRALADDDFVISYANDGEQGLEKALSELPDIILLDVEMPGINGYEVCDKLRSTELAKDIPVVFLSSHTSLRSRMQGYEVGGDDYLVKPFENENLVAKLKILSRYREEQKTLRTRFEEAQKTAHIAMTGSSELGIAMQFVEQSYTFHNYADLSNALLQLCQQYKLNCAMMVIAEDDHLWFSADEAIKPLEKEMVEMVDRSQRFVDFGFRSIINYQNLSLLVKNMPLDDMDRYGRIKDLLPMLLAAVDSKINSIKADLALRHQSEEIMRSFGQIRSRLFYLAKSLVSNQQQSAELLQSMVTELNSDLLGMGLDDDQEAYILNRIDTAIEDANKQLDASSTLYHSFRGVLSNLKQITGKQQQLQDTFAEMNRVTISVETEDDGSIEMF